MNTFILKKYDKPLVKFQIHKSIYDDASVEILWSTPEINELPEKLNGTDRSLFGWLKNRMIPRNRAFVKEILLSQGLDDNDMAELLIVCKGLSVNDVYWVTTENFNGKFEDYNLYDNSFSEALSLVAFTGYSDTIHEVSPSPEMTTNGMLPKAWRRIDQVLYLYKGGTNVELYSNGGKEPYAEYYAAQVADAMEIRHVDYDLQKWKGILASVCENFTTKDVSYVPIGYVLDAYTITSLVEKVTELGFMDDFKDMILLDAMIYNEDRHFGNFGFLKDNHTNQFIRFAPLFDHGISLFSYLSDEGIKDKQRFEEYKQAHHQSAIGATHEKLITWFCSKSDIKKLKKLYHFHFTRHPQYNLSEDRMHILENYIHNRATYLSDLITGREEKLVPYTKATSKQLNIHGEFLGFRYQYTGDDTHGGKCLLMNKENDILENIELYEHNLKNMDAVTFIEDLIEQKYYNR